MRRPIPFDAEYCRDLGHGAVRFLVGGGSNAMISVQSGRLVPIPFEDLVEQASGKTKVRLVDINSEGFRVARAYMIRLDAEDFAHAAWVDRLADAAHLSPGAFRQRFEHLAAGHKDDHYRFDDL
jgi:6-phosphofructokinase 1